MKQLTQAEMSMPYKPAPMTLGNMRANSDRWRFLDSRRYFPTLSRALRPVSFHLAEPFNAPAGFLLYRKLFIFN